jgi:hypothetical protein
MTNSPVRYGNLLGQSITLDEVVYVSKVWEDIFVWRGPKDPPFSDWTISAIKDKIECEQDIPAQDQLLIFGRRQPEDGKVSKKAPIS